MFEKTMVENNHVGHCGPSNDPILGVEDALEKNYLRSGVIIHGYNP